MTRPGLRHAPLVLLALAGAAALLSLPLAPGTAHAQLLSPGPLSQPHAEIEGDTNCNKCHSGGRKVDEPKCFACHDDLDARVKAGKGLHGTTYKGKECAVCHVEHIGKNAKLVRWPGGDRAKFEHAEAGWKLEGAHAPLECAKCHDVKNARGNATFLGLASTCTPCHADPHKGGFGTDCTACHEQTDWKKVRLTGGAAPAGFNHGKTAFPLRGKHAGVVCRKCHTGEPPKWSGIAFSSCADCHADPHQGKLGPRCAACHNEQSWAAGTEKIREHHPVLSLANGHEKVACKKCHDRGNDRPPSKGKACVSCHKNVHEAPFGTDCNRCHAGIRWLGIPRETSLAAHKETPYPLRGRHEDVACEKCHDPRKKPLQRFRQLVFDRCAACHADAHKGEFAGKSECGPCHTENGFVPTLFGVAAHASTKFPLEGRHGAVPCRGCHGSARPRLDLRNAKRACAECHANPHGEQFAVEMAHGGCAECHSAEGWTHVRIDHSAWPLTGAHAETACSSCHAPSAEDRKNGSGRTWKGVPRECEGCHADVHAGQFRLTEPARGCPECHGTEAFDITEFDHEKKAGWALDGKHAPLACERCHSAEKVKGGAATVRWRLGYRQCRDCHADPHLEKRR